MDRKIPLRGPFLEILRLGMICRCVLQISILESESGIPLSTGNTERSDEVGDAFQSEDQN